ncbi:655_t:CDS:2 [Ambispora leptoticha]|uniref:655_t:CDS:1 n=1 Tax=Ambispora leptoticha TaxID=144679 RepID=A0A9N9C7K0_9GLOM|nr:655_t:CDS:2 [Ambispora leptoticha]
MLSLNATNNPETEQLHTSHLAKRCFFMPRMFGVGCFTPCVWYCSMPMQQPIAMMPIGMVPMINGMNGGNGQNGNGKRMNGMNGGNANAIANKFLSSNSTLKSENN